MATRNQISRLAARIESLADASTSQQAVTSVIRIPDGMDQQRVLAKHRERWPVTGNGRNPVLVVWLSTGAVRDARGEPTGSELIAMTSVGEKRCTSRTWKIAPLK